MKYHELTTAPKKSPKRVGRGISAGQGKTAGRGTKGQLSRTGSKKKPGFAGGTNPIMQQLPKLPGFKSYRPKAEIVTIGQIEAIKVKAIDANVLFEHKLVSSPFVRIKLLSDGELKSAKTVKLPEASKGAVDALAKAGGGFEKVQRLQQQKKNSDSKS
ncbi:MAG: 50S ribosomal protein L15 [Candidatus Saccharibacteria bacterium]